MLKIPIKKGSKKGVSNIYRQNKYILGGEGESEPGEPSPRVRP